MEESDNKAIFEGNAQSCDIMNDIIKKDMEEKINIAELLKDCPKGMELDCALYNKVTLISVDDREDIIFPIIVMREDGYALTLTKCGQYEDADYAQCIIFPKGKTTWEGFVPPFKFKDGGIIYVKAAFEWVAIYKESNGDDLHKYVGIRVWGDVFVNDCNPLCYKGNIREIRYATEEEKQKLFQAIKDNGYKWNEETKTLEKLIEPIFKVWDKIEKCGYRFTIAGVKDDYYITKCGNKIPIDNQDDFSLVSNKFDINTLKPFESRVLVRATNDDIWRPAIYGFSNSGRYYIVGGVYWKQCIPYDMNKELHGTTNECEEYYKSWK